MAGDGSVGPGKGSVLCIALWGGVSRVGEGYVGPGSVGSVWPLGSVRGSVGLGMGIQGRRRRGGL